MTYSISFLTSSFPFISYFIRALIIEREIFEYSSRKLISRHLEINFSTLTLTIRNLTYSIYCILNSFYPCERLSYVSIYSSFSSILNFTRITTPIFTNKQRVREYSDLNHADKRTTWISIDEKSERKSGRKKTRQKESDDFMVVARFERKNLSTDPSPEKSDTEKG